MRAYYISRNEIHYLRIRPSEPSDWSTPKPVTVQGVPDGTPDGPQLTDVTVAVSPPTYAVYAAVSSQTVVVTTNDVN